jgi:pimeloyl-ACP methyl ester carboxylesterase
MPRARTGTIEVGPFVFTVDRAGPRAGPPALFLHGFPQSRHAWRAQVEALSAAGFRCVAPDQRGYSAGARPSEPEAYGVPNLVGDALGLMDAIGAQQFHLIGHDWGGQLAWLIAGLYAPERVLSLAVLSRPHPAAFARAMRDDAAQATRSAHHRAFQDADAAARLRADGLARLRRSLIAQGVPARTASAYLRILGQPGALEAAIAWYKMAGSTSPSPDAAAPVRQRTLYVWGDADATVGRMAAEGTAAHVAGPYRFEVIEGGGHFLTDQVPDRMSRLLLEHLRGSR